MASDPQELEERRRALAWLTEQIDFVDDDHHVPRSIAEGAEHIELPPGSLHNHPLRQTSFGGLLEHLMYIPEQLCVKDRIFSCSACIFAHGIPDHDAP